MKVVCAWCEQEGEAIYREREPFDDPTVTHTICPPHRVKLLEEVPSRSFPGIRTLVVVRPDEPTLYPYLTRAFAGLADVEVIVDRRRGQRRTTTRPVSIDRRRRVDRRLRKVEFSSLGYLIVRFGPWQARAVSRGVPF